MSHQGGLVFVFKRDENTRFTIEPGCLCVMILRKMRHIFWKMGNPKRIYRYLESLGLDV